MGIDGIGGGGIPPGGIGGPGGPGGPKGPKGSGEAFSVGATDAPEQAGPSDALERVQRGELSVDEYLDTRVAEATAHLQNRLPAEQLDFVKESLREQLQTDPVLVELVKRATGASV